MLQSAVFSNVSYSMFVVLLGRTRKAASQTPAPTVRLSYAHRTSEPYDHNSQPTSSNNSAPPVHRTDRPDVIDCVFERKIHALIRFVRGERLFGQIIAVLYTVEF